MAFYSSIAEVYDYIFPLNPAQVQFVQAALPGGTEKILDIGCATGSLTVELARKGYDCTGIDFDTEMVEKAEQKASAAGVEPRLMRMDMRDIPEYFSGDRFDAVLCFGNTLVHLSGMSDIRHFLTQTAIILKRGGILLLQIINYDRILEKGIGGLPAIENEKIRFDRFYDYDEENGLIDFRTVLKVKSTGQKIKNSIPLYPIRKHELEQLLAPAGFTGIQEFGDFAGSPFSPESTPLLVKASV